MKRLLLSIFLLLLFACVVQAAQMRKGPYLIFPGSNTEMTVLWQLDDTAQFPCSLEWSRDETFSRLDGCVDSSEYGDDHQHKYTISGLKPGKKYYYRVTADGAEHIGSFLAAPPDDAKSVKFLAYGDTRSHPEDQDRVNSAMVTLFEEDPEYQTLTLLSGDWVTYGGFEEDWDEEFFDPVWTNTHYMQANLPINGCVGNHDIRATAAAFKKYWPYPYVNGYFWSFEYGPALFLIIDQYDAKIQQSGPYGQLDWIEHQLATTDKEWKILHFHEPGYSAGTHDDNLAVQEFIQPLCEQYGVDIVFNGHNHNYAHCDVNGVNHIVTGGGGAPLREVDWEFCPYIVACREAYHFCKVEIKDNELYFEAWDVNEDLPLEERLIDSFTISH